MMHGERSRRVVMATTHQVDDQRIRFRLAASLSETNCDVHLVGRPGRLKNPESFEIDTIAGSIEGPKARFRLASAVFRRALALKPNVLMLHDPELLALATFHRPSCTIIYDSHENYDLKFANRLPGLSSGRGMGLHAARAFGHFEGWAIRRIAHGVAVVVPRQLDYYNQFLRVGRGGGVRVGLVPNYPTRRIFSPVSLEGIADGRPYDVIHVGSLSPERGVSLLPHIVEELVRRSPHPLRIGVIARTYVSRHDKLIDDVKRAGGTHIEWLPSVPHPEIPRLLRQSKVLLSPLQSTGQNEYVYPTKLFEAWSQGTPTVAGDVGYSGSLTRESGAGVAVDASRAAAYAEAALGLLRSSGRWISAARAGVDYVFAQRKSWEEGAVPELMELLEHGLAER